MGIMITGGMVVLVNGITPTKIKAKTASNKLGKNNRAKKAKIISKMIV